MKVSILYGSWPFQFTKLLLFVSIFGFNVNGEVFTALVDLEKLLEIERLIVSSLDYYLIGEERRLRQLQNIREKFASIESIASQDVHSYLANPVNAFLLVKTLTSDWKHAEALIEKSYEIGKQSVSRVQNSSGETFPSTEDFNGAADALLRLQDTYKLDTSSLARGEIRIAQQPSYTQQFNNENSPATLVSPKKMELSAGDCFELGRYSYVNGDHYHTILWMQEAADRWEDEVVKTADKAEILEYLAFSTFRRGNVRHALKLTTELLKLVPNHPRAIGNKIYYEESLGKNGKAKLRGDVGDDDVPIDENISAGDSSTSIERQSYEALCRGETVLPPRIAKTLTCFYLNTTNKHPYLRLMRVKVEQAYNKPAILIYHGIMSDNEIETVKQLALPRLKRATVQNHKTGQLEAANYRISKSAWLKGSDHEVVDRVNQRIEDITGLTVDTAEELQVVNYGIGGHYEPHFDFATQREMDYHKADPFASLGTGNRISTWLNYMSNVEAGGATVFPQLELALWPEKGSAAFWYNLHPSGDGDLLTRHAACPVLVGSKWVSNKWFHERGQEFRRPCGLKRND
ncbi:prolyl 4-hydroxylase subunit alpha-1 [Tetranychus urticae]|uniref:procollagen-proline 4-dioxygenase n=1 Tax=Tetranychus urticae TaxID=32264 RepID=T1KD57_TETUR|nr:prolyl 4-hydroxylase subunit alpha-1 [Tetranychus urticae]